MRLSAVWAVSGPLAGQPKAKDLLLGHCQRDVPVRDEEAAGSNPATPTSSEGM